MPLFSTVVIHRGNKDTLKIQTLVTHFRNIKSKSLSVRPMALYFTKFLPGNSDAGSSVQVCELASVSHCSGAFNFSGTFWPVTPFVFEREYTEMKIEAQKVCWLRHDGQVCHTGPGEDRLVGDFRWTSSNARCTDWVEVAMWTVSTHNWGEEKKDWRFCPLERLFPQRNTNEREHSLNCVCG